MNGRHSDSGLLAHDGNGSALDRISPDAGLTPLNLEASSAPVPPSPTSARPTGLGRATSSKRCILFACFVSVTAIALGVGLGVGLNSSDDGSSSGGGSQDNTTSTATTSTATVYGASLPQDCQQMATTNYWDIVAISKYDINPLTLTAAMFEYNSSSSGGSSGAASAFSATAALLFTVQQQAASCVVLNARNLTFSRVSLQTRGSDGSLSAATDVCGGAAATSCQPGAGVLSPPFELRASSAATRALSSLDTDLVAISLGTSLQPGTSAVLQLEYSGLLGAWPSASTGLLRSAPFPSADSSQLEVLVATQGETDGARQLLPCYDRPAAKAAFALTLQVPSKTPAGSDTVALSNTPVRSVLGGDQDAVKVYEFEETPLMSPYLFAIAAGDLVQYKSTSMKGGGGGVSGTAAGVPEVRLWAVPGLERQLAAAADVAPRAFQFYARYLNVSLPSQLSKMDLVAVPGRTGAMENWGLLMMDEARFLFDPSWSGIYNLKQTVTVVCHEVGHQWVGNLATKQDWAMLSVDEGLVSLLEYKCMNEMSGFQGHGGVHFFRSCAPQLQQPGAHDSPSFQALTLAADPTQPPMVPQSDLDIGTGSYMQYSKPAALIHNHELYLQESNGGQDVLPSILSLMLSRAAYSTWNWSQYFVAARDALLQLNTPVSMLVAQGVEQRAGSFMRAQSYDEVMQAIAAGPLTMATWFYSPLYPIVTLDQNLNTNAPIVSLDDSPPSPPVADPTNQLLVNLYNYNLTLFNIGATSYPFCAYQLSAELAGQLGVEEEASQVQAPCSIPAGRRYFPLTLALDNLTYCASSGDGEGAWAASFDRLMAASPPTWVDNRRAARLMRSVYNDMAHYDSLVATMSRMTSVCPDDAAANASCCTRQSDLLEGAAFLYDALTLAQTGRQQPAAQGLTAVAALQAVEGAARKAGAPSDGQWQYLIGRAALDSLLAIKRFADWVQDSRPQCSADFSAYALDVLGDASRALQAEWLSGTAVANDTLKQSAGPRSLWLLGLLGSEPVTTSLCEAFTTSPLWQRVLDALGGGQGDAGGQPSAATVASGSPGVSPDLLPAAYMAGSALPARCNASLLGAQGVPDGTAVADLAAPVLTALQRCYLTDASAAEAQRCLYAVPVVALLTETEDFQQQPSDSLVATLTYTRTLPWLLLTASTNGSACVAFRASPPLYARCLRRAHDLAQELPALFTILSRLSTTQHATVLQFMQENWRPQMCPLVAALVPPSSQAVYDQLITLLTTGPAKDCPAAVKIRAAGQAEQQKEVLEAQAEAACDYVAEQLDTWAKQG